MLIVLFLLVLPGIRTVKWCCWEFSVPNNRVQLMLELHLLMGIMLVKLVMLLGPILLVQILPGINNGTGEH